MRRNQSEDNGRSPFCYKHQHRTNQTQSKDPTSSFLQNPAQSGSLSLYPLALDANEGGQLEVRG